MKHEVHEGARLWAWAKPGERSREDVRWGSVGLSEPSAETARCQSLHYRLTKWMIDVPASTILLLLLSPVFAGVALAIRLTSPGPVFFRQKRLGRHGRLFHCYKFRTMHVDAERVLESDPDLYDLYVRSDYKLPLRLDPRVTRVGRWLRRTSLDELPQLVNVLKGQMSLVGPRPIVPPEIEEYGERASDLLCALPGITGRWQVSGRSSLHYPKRAEVELEYVYRWSVQEDLRILAKTVPTVLSRRGAV